LRYLATLFGLTLLSHQVGAFFGAWLGGLAVTRFGDYSWMWIADITLALFAAFVNLPIREARLAAEPAGARA
jgi:predicted MFS family arabinose efflux permease